MNLTILGGTLKGLKWNFPEFKTLRPTSVMLRRRIFDKFQDLSSFGFVDLCAGSGMMGLEALSRGASSVYLIENDKKIYFKLKEFIQNEERLKSEAKSLHLENGDFKNWLNKNESLWLNSKPWILYFDPPYEKSDLYHFFLEYFLEKLKNSPQNLIGKIIFLEYDEQKTKNAKTWDWKIWENYGAKVSFLKQSSSILAIIQFSDQ
ncbi:MAG: RsmD family RNA methyltransferase [Bacteriovoracaceae bacterium]|nr:RsmD family RNA methyltransferase [Bacteriovoracaceae bacterium]